MDTQQFAGTDVEAAAAFTLRRVGFGADIADLDRASNLGLVGFWTNYLNPTAALDIQLKAAASLIATRPALRAVTVGIDGFDTHADQLDRHSDLLGQTANALANFWAALGSEGQERTLIMTTTEFGRRVGENGSDGTDHGRASTQFLLGAGVAGGQVAGSYGLNNLVDGDLPIAVPAVDLYADALRWLGGPVAEVLSSEPPQTGLVLT